MIDLDNQTALHFDLPALEKIATSLSTKDVELIIVDDETMKSLNIEHREKESSTDVLSFPLDAPFTEPSIFSLPLGSIVISSSFVKKKADELGHSIQDELSLLFIHGYLHLLGFDHEVDDGEMREKEKEIIEAFNLPKSLIIRTGE
jgi:probable rRNA maturation factor